MKLFTLSSLCLIFLGISNSLSAQLDSIPRVKYEKQVKETVNDMLKAYSGIPKTKNIEPFLAFFDKSYTTNRVRINVNSEIEFFNNDILNLEKLLGILKNTPNFEIEYKMGKVFKVWATETTAYIMFEAVFNTRRDNQDYVSGEEMQTYFFKRVNDKWKVIGAQSIQIRENVNRFTCDCHIYKSTASEDTYMATTEIPEGTVFSKKLNTFTFEKTNSGFRMVDVDGQKYSWDSDGTIRLMVKGMNQEKGEMVGKADKPVEAMMQIIKNSLYPKNCSAVKVVK